jgi:hypothetical protein
LGGGLRRSRLRRIARLALGGRLTGDDRRLLAAAVEQVVCQERRRHDDGRTDCDQDSLQNA